MQKCTHPKVSGERGVTRGEPGGDMCGLSSGSSRPPLAALPMLLSPLCVSDADAVSEGSTKCKAACDVAALLVPPQVHGCADSVHLATSHRRQLGICIVAERVCGMHGC